MALPAGHRRRPAAAATAADAPILRANGGQPPCFHSHDAPPGVSRSYDCEVRQHAWEFGKATLPWRGEFKTGYEALQLEACGIKPPPEYDTFEAPSFPAPAGAHLIFVDADAAPGGDGTQTKPFGTLEAAVHAANMPGRKAILLKAGTYHTMGVVLAAAHSDLTIQNQDGGEVIISGAVPVKSDKLKWSVSNKATNTWKLDTSEQDLPTEFGMRVGTRRAIRAKWPNGDPETAAAYCVTPAGLLPSVSRPDALFYTNGSGLSSQYPRYFPRAHKPIDETREWWAHPDDWPGTFWHDVEAGHPQSIGGYGPFFYAAGGVCSGRTPSHGYWCSSHNPRGSLGQANIDPPGGFLFKGVLPQAAKYKNITGAIVHARGGGPFYTYMCAVTGANETALFFDPEVGCDQGGPAGFGPGDWYIENVLEECDSPGEYFVDATEKSLYYTFNGTEQPTGAEIFSLTRTKVLFNISGTMDSPVKNVTIQGLTLRDAAFTYLGTTEADRHWLPSEGDWALQRSGAVHIEGAEGVTFHRNQMTRCDGNGVFLGGYTRGVNISANDFNWSE